MIAVPGDISIDTFTIGGLDLTDPSQATFNTLDIYEDILNPVFIAEVEVLDYNDALGTNKLDGSQEVNLSFSVPGAGSCTFKFALLANKNLDDKTFEKSGSMKHKTYKLRMISKDALKNQSNHLAKSFNQPTHQTVQDALKTITDAQINVPDPCKGNQRLIANHEKVYDFLKNIHGRHVSQQNQSSLYTLFAGRNGSQENRTFCTFEHLMSQGSVFDLKQDNTIGGRTTTESDGMNNMLWLHVPDSFYTPVTYNAGSSKSVYDVGTGKSKVEQNPSTNIVLPTAASSATASYQSDANSAKNLPLRHYHNDQFNDKTRTDIDKAKVKRADYLKEIAQNSAKFEINGNPNIAVGNIVTMNIPKKADADHDSGETQMNDKVLITKLRHRIKPAGTRPRYTMVIEAIKGGYSQ